MNSRFPTGAKAMLVLVVLILSIWLLWDAFLALSESDPIIVPPPWGDRGN